MAKNRSSQIFTIGELQTNNASLVQIMNDEMIQLLIPALVYITLIMVLGLFGNAFVCYYYTFKEKKSTNTFFIVVLSLYDLLACFITMPTEIATITLYYTFVDNIACKILRFVNIFLEIASILRLVGIASDRYKRICHVTRPQMNMPQARRVSVYIVLLSILVAIPSLFTYEIVRIPIANNSTLDLYGHSCTRTKEASHRIFVLTYNTTQFFCFVVLLAALVVSTSLLDARYIFTKKRLRRQFKRNHKERKINKYAETISVTSSSLTFEKGQIKRQGIRRDASVDQLVRTETVEQSEPRMPFPGNAEPISSECLDVIDDTNKPDNKIQYTSEPDIVKDVQRSNQFDADTVRVTLLMITVTLIFIVSFLPYLSLAVWSAIEGRGASLLFSKLNADFVVYHIGVRSYLLNSALNPWIYGIFNSQFRQLFFSFCFGKRG